MIPSEVRRRLSTQRKLSRLFFPILGGSVAAAVRIRGYRVEGREELRRRFAEIVRQHPGPLLICPNHLTMIDSVLLDRALVSNWTYLKNFKLFPWNIPEWEHVRTNVGFRIVCYLTKCAPFRREGTPEQKRHVLDKLAWLLEEGDSVVIFPEGKRSKTGRLDMENFGYGVGQLSVRVPSAAIVCVYLRGETAVTSSGWPNRGDRIYADLKLVHPHSPHKGRRAARDISVQAMEALREMEEKYFREHPGAESLSCQKLESVE